MIYVVIVIIIYVLISYIMFMFLCARKMAKLFGVVDKKIEETLIPYKDINIKANEWYSSQKKEHYSINSFDGIKLNATFIRNKREKYTLVISHGYRSTPNRDLFSSLSEYYNMGASILILESRACATSGGNYITFGYKESLDIDKWINYIYNKNNKPKIILAGISLGATSSLLVHNKHVKMILVDSPFRCAYKEIRYVINHYFHLPGFIFMPMINVIFMIYNGISLKRIDTYQFYKHEKDILLIEGATHGMGYLVDRDKYISKLSGFIKKYMKKF